MHACPHCHAETIPGCRKANATRIRPARCTACGGLSYVSSWHHALLAVLVEVSIWGTIIIALVARSWRALLLLPAGIAAAAALFVARGKLLTTDAAAVSRERRKSLLQLAGFAAGLFVLWLVFGGNAGAS